MVPCKNSDAERRHPGSYLHFTIEVEANSHHNILRAELSRRETAEEMHEFIKALNAEIHKSGCKLTLIRVRHSRPIFKAEHYAGLARLAADPGIRVALVAHTEELRASHHYVELLTRQQGANVRGFNDEASALDWLKNGR
jgi:hypothetical protein